MPLATSPGGAAAPAAPRPQPRRGTTTTQGSGAMIAPARATAAMDATVAIAAVARTLVSGQPAGCQRPGTHVTRTAHRPAQGPDGAGAASGETAAHERPARRRPARRRPARRRPARRQRGAIPGRRCSPGGRGMRRSEVQSEGRGRPTTGLPTATLAGAEDSARRPMTCGAGSGSEVQARVGDGPKLAGPGLSKPELGALRAGPAVCGHELAASATATTATTATGY
jgi:hypothetical protein